VRPLYDDGASAAQEATRDYVLELEGEAGEPPLLNIFGGKITTYRRLAGDALEKLEDHLPEAGAPWTRGAALPGGHFSIDGFEALVAELMRDYPQTDAALIRRFARTYGTCARDILAVEEPGIHFGADLYQREVEYLERTEWAMTADDILWRRTKLGLRLTVVEKGHLEQWLGDNRATVTGPAARG
jgi:glycerol-3-phosphate dehydrogenase